MAWRKNDPNLTNDPRYLEPRIEELSVQLDELEQEFEQVVSNVTVDSEVILARNSTVKGKTFTTVDGRLEELESDTYFPIENVIINGDMNNGTIGINSQAYDLTTSGNELITTVNSNSDGARVGFDVGGETFHVNDKYYVSFDILAKYQTYTSLSFRGFGVTPDSSHLITPNQWSKVSQIVNATSSGTGYLFFYHVTNTDYVIGDIVKWRRFLTINLTQHFGEGNEPTKAEMDKILSTYPDGWFDATVNLAENKKMLKFLLNEIRGKASKTQEAWITPTLLNGATTDVNDPVRYRKNQFGVVEFKGKVTVVNASAVLGLPVGYRTGSNELRRIPLITNTNTFANAAIQSGTLFLTVGTIDLYGLRFIAEG